MTGEVRPPTPEPGCEYGGRCKPGECPGPCGNDDNPDLWDGQPLHGEDGTPLIGNWPLHMCEQHAREADHADAPYNSHLLAALRAVDLLRADVEGWKILHASVVDMKQRGHARSMEILIENREVYYQFRDHVAQIADQIDGVIREIEPAGVAISAAKDAARLLNSFNQRLRTALSGAPDRPLAEAADA